MKAMVQRAYGDPADVLAVREVDRPEPGDDEVLIRVRASSVNAKDWMQLVGRFYLLRLAYGLRRPRRKIRGVDVAGTVEAIGPRVTRFRAGDAVFGELSGGAYAEYAIASEDELAPKPSSLGFCDAAAVPLAGVTALQGIRDAGCVRAGHRVLINGASGGVGTFAVQIAKSLGAHVTGVCSTDSLELVRSIGADDVIDYGREDFTRGRERYDVIFDLVGNHPLSDYRRVMRRDGVYIAASGMPGGPLLGPIPYLVRVALTSLRPGPRMRPFAAKPTSRNLSELTELIEAGEVRPVIERTYGFSDIPAALARQGEGHARGKKVVAVGSTQPDTAGNPHP
jgi:NADPH:quinone reductase-like Zn-dependent oxidoreductase